MTTSSEPNTYPPGQMTDGELRTRRREYERCLRGLPVGATIRPEIKTKLDAVVTEMTTREARRHAPPRRGPVGL